MSSRQILSVTAVIMWFEDFTTETDEKLSHSVIKIKQMYEDYNSMLPERFKFMKKHEKTSNGVYMTEYSNGTKVFVDYNKETFETVRK